MAFCRVCGAKFQWGFCGDRWVPLEPIGTHDDLDRTYIDENGELRADHRDRHDDEGESAINVTRLERKVKAPEVEPVANDVSIGEAQDELAGEKGWFEKMRGK